jgi:ribosomal protein L30
MSSAVTTAAKTLLFKVTYKRCGLHTNSAVRDTLYSLGLRKLNQSVVVKNVRPIRGMIHKVRLNFLSM